MDFPIFQFTVCTRKLKSMESQAEQGTLEEYCSVLTDSHLPYYSFLILGTCSSQSQIRASGWGGKQYIFFGHVINYCQGMLAHTLQWELIE